MPLISVVIVLVVIGVIMWAVNTYIPMSAPIKNILNVVVIVFICLWLLQLFGIFAGGGPIIGRPR